MANEANEARDNGSVGVNGRGKFIAIDGIDGSGKTTQARLLARLLDESGRSSIFTSEPMKTGPIGSVIYQSITGKIPALRWDTMALLFAADRIQHIETVVRPTLERGVNVVCDRYLPSSIVYQGETAPRSLSGESLPWVLPWIANLNRNVPFPDLTIILDVPEEVAAARREARGGEAVVYEQREFQKRAAKRYKDFIGIGLVHVPGDGTEEEVTARIWAAVDRFFRMESAS